MMRVALISDIHGNVIALDAVLEDIEQQDVDQVVCLGDVATLGPQPREVIARLRDLGCDGIIGNHDRNLCDPAFLAASRAMYTARVLDATAWCQDLLTLEDLAYLRTYQPSQTFDLGRNLRLFCFHGSPTSCQDVIGIGTQEAVLDAHFAHHTAAVLAGGHTHVQMLRRYRGALLINPGSVGQPFERFPFVGERPRIFPWAEYAIVSQHEGRLSVDFHRVPVDVAVVRQAVVASGFPLQDILLEAL